MPFSEAPLRCDWIRNTTGLRHQQDLSSQDTIKSRKGSANINKKSSKYIKTKRRHFECRLTSMTLLFSTLMKNGSLLKITSTQKSANSPFIGIKLCGKVKYTFCCGNILYLHKDLSIPTGVPISPNFTGNTHQIKQKYTK